MSNGDATGKKILDCRVAAIAHDKRLKAMAEIAVALDASGLLTDDQRDVLISVDRKVLAYHDGAFAAEAEAMSAYAAILDPLAGE